MFGIPHLAAAPHHGQLVLPPLIKSIIDQDDASSFSSSSRSGDYSVGPRSPAKPAPIGEESSSDTEDESTLRLDGHEASRTTYWSQLRESTRTASLFAVNHDQPIFRPRGVRDVQSHVLTRSVVAGP